MLVGRVLLEAPHNPANVEPRAFGILATLGIVRIADLLAIRCNRNKLQAVKRGLSLALTLYTLKPFGNLRWRRVRTIAFLALTFAVLGWLLSCMQSKRGS